MSFLKEETDGNLDAPSTTIRHREIILRKRFLRNLYVSWYRSFLEQIKELPEGKMVEIGSGGGFLKTLDSRIVTSDVMALPHCDMVFSGEGMPFEDNTLGAIFMIDVLHHIPDCEQFFAEAQRTLKQGGRIVMIEPANTRFSRFIYQNFHHEKFDPAATDWRLPAGGPLSGANGALPWIVFQRDYERFARLFPGLKKQSMKLHTPFAYLVFGGFAYKSILPGWLFPAFRAFEFILSPFASLLAMFQTIVVTKA